MVIIENCTTRQMHVHFISLKILFVRLIFMSSSHQHIHFESGTGIEVNSWISTLSRNITTLSHPSYLTHQCVILMISRLWWSISYSPPASMYTMLPPTIVFPTKIPHLQSAFRFVFFFGCSSVNFRKAIYFPSVAAINTTVTDTVAEPYAVNHLRFF